MNARLYANLVELMEKFIEENCESDNWPDFWADEDLAEDMASAAKLVIIGRVKAQRFYRDEVEEEK